MEIIKDKNGKVIKRSRNLRGLREYASKNIIKLIRFENLGKFGGRSTVIFDAGETSITVWADYNVMTDKLTNWSMFKGAPVEYVKNGDIVPC